MQSFHRIGSRHAILTTCTSSIAFQSPDDLDLNLSTPTKDVVDNNCNDSRSVGGNSSIHDHHNIVNHMVIVPDREETAYSYQGKGVNFFLRMGLIGR